MTLHRGITIAAYVASVGKARLRRPLKEGARRPAPTLETLRLLRY